MATTRSADLFPPPLLSDRPPVLRVVLAGVVPLAFGALCGWALGASATLYLVLAVPVAILGGFGAGIEHRGPGAGARRGALGGLLFGTAIVVVHSLIGGSAEVSQSDPPILLAVLTCVMGAVLGAAGGAYRARLDARAGGPVARPGGRA